MNLDDAVLAHTKWKIRLKHFLSGRGEEVLTADKVAKDNLCDLGKWIYGEGSTLADCPEYARLKQEHALFHKCAGRVIALAVAGKTNEAEQMLSGSGEFTTLSTNVVRAINECKKIVK